MNAPSDEPHSYARVHERDTMLPAVGKVRVYLSQHKMCVNSRDVAFNNYYFACVPVHACLSVSVVSSFVDM